VANAAKTVAASERIYAVGDIHGRFDLLNLMLAEISKDISGFSDARKARIIFMGDYIDRGDQSREVIELLSDIASIRDTLNDETDVRIDFLAGNHEIAMLDFLRDPVRSSAWLEWGGQQTIASFGIVPSARSNADDLIRIQKELTIKASPYLGFLKGLDKLLVSGDVVFVHAGLDPDYELNAQPDEAAYWGRPVTSKALGVRNYRMVHGHFAAPEPVLQRDRICIDTGAYYSGCLTAVRLDETEAFLQVKA